MPDTEKREEGKGLPKGASSTPASGPGKDEAQTGQGNPAASMGEPPAEARGETAYSQPDVTGGQSIGDFADSVVSGLEHANLAGGEKEGAGLHSLDLEHMSEAFFAGWGDAEEGGGDAHAGGHSANTRTLSEVSLSSLASGKSGRGGRSGQEGANDLSQMSMASWSASESPSSSNGRGQAEGRGFSVASDVSLASWGASGGMGAEDSDFGSHEESGHQIGGTQTLAGLGAGLGLPSGPVYGEYAAQGSDPSKHDELADAVESALRSVYGDQQAKQSARPFQRAIAEEKSSPSLVWNRSADPSNDDLTPQEVIFNYFDYNSADEGGKPAQAAEPRRDGQTPQEVILNYFDYQGTQNGNGYPRGGMSNARDYDESISLRSTHEPVVPLRRSPQHEERPVYREEWTTQAPQPQQYSGPPSFPVPGPALPPRPAVAAQMAAQDSGRLLGAAAIGLMGGIAIAASLAAFLIYGPHPAAVDIPGIGNLRLDRDEQGYGRTLQEEAASQPARSRGRASVEMSSEILASDAVAVPGQPAPLSISIRSAQPFEKMLVSISGVPEGGRLSAGVDTGGGNWLIAPRRLNGLTINLPQDAPGLVSLEAQLLDSNARTPLSARGTFALRVMQPGGTPSAAYSEPASAPAIPARQPQQQTASGYPFTTQVLTPQPAPLAAASVQPQAPETAYRPQPAAPAPQPQRQAALAPMGMSGMSGMSGMAGMAAFTNAAPRRAALRPEVEDLIREGNKRMREGDIVEARQFYQRAVSYGDAEASLAMGRSYDPIYFARIEKKNADPDASKAFDWYKKAMDAGASQTAMVRIENLKHFLNE